jgi:hypothetical protein
MKINWRRWLNLSQPKIDPLYDHDVTIRLAFDGLGVAGYEATVAGISFLFIRTKRGKYETPDGLRYATKIDAVRGYYARLVTGRVGH